MCVKLTVRTFVLTMVPGPPTREFPECTVHAKYKEAALPSRWHVHLTSACARVHMEAVRRLGWPQTG